jgi:HEAT repeat protein
MITPHDAGAGPRLRDALGAPDPSDRLRAALSAGTYPDPGHVETLVERFAIEPDFYVRDMLTWALTRHPAALTVPLLLDETKAESAQARSQALHTLSKVGDSWGWTAVTPALLKDPDDDVARSAWRAAVVLVPEGDEGELAGLLATQLGRGDRTVQLSLSRALAALGDAAAPTLTDAANHRDPDVRAHAMATERLVRDPDEGFDAAIFEAKRHIALKDAPITRGNHADR